MPSRIHFIGALALTGCGAGQIAHTATQQAAVDGASGDAGDDIALRGVLMPSSPNPSGSYPVGSNVPVLATIINSGGEADELVAVTSPMAGRVQVSGTVRIPPRRNIVSDTDPSALMSRRDHQAPQEEVMAVLVRGIDLEHQQPDDLGPRNDRARPGDSVKRIGLRQ